MPKPKLGGYLYQDIAAAMGYEEGEDIDMLQDAIELLFTADPLSAAKLIKEVMRHLRKRKTGHDFLQANDVEKARQIYLNEIKPALKAENEKPK